MCTIENDQSYMLKVENIFSQVYNSSSKGFKSYNLSRGDNEAGLG